MYPLPIAVAYVSLGALPEISRKGPLFTPSCLGEETEATTEATEYKDMGLFPYQVGYDSENDRLKISVIGHANPRYFESEICAQHYKFIDRERQERFAAMSVEQQTCLMERQKSKGLSEEVREHLVGRAKLECDIEAGRMSLQELSKMIQTVSLSLRILCLYMFGPQDFRDGQPMKDILKRHSFQTLELYGTMKVEKSHPALVLTEENVSDIISALEASKVTFLSLTDIRFTETALNFLTIGLKRTELTKIIFDKCEMQYTAGGSIRRISRILDEMKGIMASGLDINLI